MTYGRGQWSCTHNCGVGVVEAAEAMVAVALWYRTPEGSSVVAARERQGVRRRGWGCLCGPPP